MNAPLAIRPAWTIVQRIWIDRWWGFCALAAVASVSYLGLRISGAVFAREPVAHVVIIMTMGLSLLFVFLLCNFTEADRKERRSGFPARLFVLPVPTRTLVAAPILFGVAMAAIIHTAWTAVAVRVVGREAPLVLPILYVTTAMICYHAIVWSLARHAMVRLIALSFGGAGFEIGWILIYDHSWLGPFMGGVSVPLVIGAVLAVMGGIGFVVAFLAVESQRHGGRSVSDVRLRVADFIIDALPRTQRRLDSPARAQFWIEWRRHGMLLPLCTAAVLILAMLPAPFIAPISAPVTAVLFKCMLLAPIVLAFALGQGFGKADLWSKQAEMSLFLATRPLANSEWIGAKMKTAAVASLASWAVVIVLVPLWLRQWCDDRLVMNLWHTAERLYSPAVLRALPGLTFGILLVVTWRFLVAGLFVGLAGRGWLLTLATCNVFFAVCAGPGLIVIWMESPHILRPFLKWPVWAPSVLTVLFVAKIIAASLVAHYARRRGWIQGRAILRYVALWCAMTAFLLLAGWWLLPVSGWNRWLSVMLILFAVPLARVAYAPVALARNRHR